VSTRTRPGRGRRAGPSGHRRTGAPAPATGAANAFWPLACAAAAAAVVFLVAAGYWSPSASVAGAPIGAADGATAVAAALLLAAAAGPVRSGWSAGRR
jgi:hypothetical protein